MTTRQLLLAASALALVAGTASAETLRWARTADSLTLDPHAQNEGPTTTFAHQIMEPLIMRDMTGVAKATFGFWWFPSCSSASAALTGRGWFTRYSPLSCRTGFMPCRYEPSRRKKQRGDSPADCELNGLFVALLAIGYFLTDSIN